MLSWIDPYTHTYVISLMKVLRTKGILHDFKYGYRSKRDTGWKLYEGDDLFNDIFYSCHAFVSAAFVPAAKVIFFFSTNLA